MILQYNAELETYQEMVRSEFMHWTHEDDLKLMKEISYRKGIEAGEKKGKKLGILKTAFSMLQEGIDISLIKKVTGLSEKEILDFNNSKIINN